LVVRTKHRLTAKVVENKKKPGLYADGGNLYLRVARGGSKSWIFRFTLSNGPRDAGLGGYPSVSLAEARNKAEPLRKQIAEGIDPIEARKTQRAASQAEAERAITFEQCAKAYVASHEVGWKNDKHRAQWHSTLKTYVYPVIGQLPVKTVDTSHVMQILEPIWMTKPETGSRLRGRIEVILSWAKVRGYREGENPAQWRGHLDHLLPAKGKVRKVVHHAALPYSEMPTFISRLRSHTSATARALEFLILTNTRTSETLKATWSEIDLERRLWIIPGSRMKADKEHRVPLSSRAVEVVVELAEIRCNDYVFPGMKLGRPFSENALLMLLRRMGYEQGYATGHGFRSTFKDWVSECTNLSMDASEIALSHKVANAVEAAYRRGDMFEKRREMMEAWSAFCAGVDFQPR
jgi:integrase